MRVPEHACRHLLERQKGDKRMFDHLAIDVDYLADWSTGRRQQHSLYIPGSTLLEWVDAAARAVQAGASAPPGSGSQADPYVLGGYGRMGPQGRGVAPPGIDGTVGRRPRPRDSAGTGGVWTHPGARAGHGSDGTR